jgi:YhcH/YjgK/YiaL family protein
MLNTTVALAERYDYLSDRFRKAYAFLGRDDLATMPTGRHEIDGDAVFANVMDVTTVPAASKDFEAHRRYFDVQFVVDGEEEFQVAPLEGLTCTSAYDGKGDCALYAAPSHFTRVVLRSGDMAVVGPEEAHRPACSLDAPVTERKVVVKVAVD